MNRRTVSYRHCVFCGAQNTCGTAWNVYQGKKSSRHGDDEAERYAKRNLSGNDTWRGRLHGLNETACQVHSETESCIPGLCAIRCVQICH